MSQSESIKELIKDLTQEFGLAEYSWVYDLSELRKEQPNPISQGGLATIWKKRIKFKKVPYGGQIVAVRVVNKFWRETAIRNEERSKQMCKYLKREFRVWSELGSHPNIAGLMGFVTEIENNEFPGFLMPWYDYTNLRDFLEEKNSKPGVTYEKLNFLHDIIVGLEFLHSKEIVHRDLKGKNVLIGKDKKACLADFGGAKFLMFSPQDVTRSSIFNNNIHWMPPEYVMLDDKGGFGSSEAYHNPAPSGDIWSYGCTFYEVIRVGDPYQSYDVQNILLNSKEKHPPPPTFREDLQIEPKYWRFMQKQCWDVNQKARISAADAVLTLAQFLQEIPIAEGNQGSS